MRRGPELHQAAEPPATGPSVLPAGHVWNDSDVTRTAVDTTGPGPDDVVLAFRSHWSVVIDRSVGAAIATRLIKDPDGDECSVPGRDLLTGMPRATVTTLGVVRSVLAGKT